MSLGLIVVLLGLVVLHAGAQQASVEASSSPFTLNVSLSGFVVPVGEKLAVELVREASSDAATDPIVVKAWTLTNADGELLKETVYDDGPEIADWLGSVSLCDTDGTPLPVGHYTLEISTAVGTFTVGLQAIDGVPSGRFRLSATVCGLSIELYRLVTEEDAGRTLDLRVGDQLMVVLQGNPTTGYEWSNALLYEYAVLRALAEPEYRPTSMDTGMVGAGGLYLFRFEAVDVGSQAFRFVYQRPWESTDSDREFVFDVVVR
jgi:inhibitor of cysteine peptidase